MKKLIIILLYNWFGILFIGLGTLKAQSPNNASDSLTRFVAYVENEMEKVDKTNSIKTTLSKQLPYSGSASKKIKVTIDVRDSIVRRLAFASYDESFTTVGKETYYFDTVGKLISHVSIMTGMTIHEIYAGQKVFVYSKVGTKINGSSSKEDDVADYIFADTKFRVDYYLSNFQGVKYSTFDISRNTSIILKTLIAVDLRKAPDIKSPLLKKLPKGAELQYLDRSGHPDSLFNKGTWIWFKVRDKSKQEGWIWGHPSMVKEY